MVTNQGQGILLDSSAIIAHFRGRLDLFKLIGPGEPLFIPLVVLGELLKGALKSDDPPKHQEKIATLLKVGGVLNPDSATAESYARISVALETKGRPIPENDVWIAAVALECGMPLMTRDDHSSWIFRKSFAGSTR